MLVLSSAVRLASLVAIAGRRADVQLPKSRAKNSPRAEGALGAGLHAMVGTVAVEGVATVST